MFNLKISRIILIVILCLLLSSASVFAQSGTVTLSYESIKIEINGDYFIPTDANRTVVEPFIIDGTTYVPVRAIGEAFGKEVVWDGPTKSIFVGEKPETFDNPMTGTKKTVVGKVGSNNVNLSYESLQIFIDGKKITPQDVNGKTVDPFIIDGTTYLPIRAVGTALNKTIDWYAPEKIIFMRDRIVIPESEVATGYSESNPAPIGVAQSYNPKAFNGEKTFTIRIKEVSFGKNGLVTGIYELVTDVSTEEYRNSEAAYDSAFYSNSELMDGDPIVSTSLWPEENMTCTFEFEARPYNHAFKVTKMAFGIMEDPDRAIWFDLTK